MVFYFIIKLLELDGSKIILSKRLQAVFNLVSKNTRAADIGADHAFLAIELIKKNISSFVIAGEVAPGPLENSKINVEQNNLEDKISVRLGDGLEVINDEDEIDTIIIAGMGGILINNILNAGYPEKFNHVKELVLQPNIGEPLVRKWLMEHNFEIVDENILEDDNHIYEMIKARFVEVPAKLKPEELLMGPKLLEDSGNETFQKKWHKKYRSNELALENIQKSAIIDDKKVDKMTQENQMIKKVLRDE